jgi:hypothetical protein
MFIANKIEVGRKKKKKKKKVSLILIPHGPFKATFQAGLYFVTCK